MIVLVSLTFEVYRRNFFPTIGFSNFTDDDSAEAQGNSREQQHLPWQWNSQVTNFYDATRYTCKKAPLALCLTVWTQALLSPSSSALVRWAIE